MTEYIDRQELVEIIAERNRNTCNGAMSCLQMRRMVERVPAADVAPVVHGTPVTEVRTRTIAVYHEEIGVLAGDRSTLYRRNVVRVGIPYDHCPVCGATLCSRWHNFCGKCGARMDMDGGAEDG